jgi:hypothetical protein
VAAAARRLTQEGRNGLDRGAKGGRKRKREREWPAEEKERGKEERE